MINNCAVSDHGLPILIQDHAGQAGSIADPGQCGIDGGREQCQNSDASQLRVAMSEDSLDQTSSSSAPSEAAPRSGGRTLRCLAIILGLMVSWHLYSSADIKERILSSYADRSEYQDAPSVSVNPVTNLGG